MRSLRRPASSPTIDENQRKERETMAIEISNAIHAMAIVTVDDAGHPIFVGQGNVGFAPFGIGPNFSEQLAQGRYRLHMLAPISILTPNPVAGRGEGLVIAEPLTNTGTE